jgi:hypothetical protein
MRRLIATLLAVLAATTASTEPFWGAKTSRPAGTDPASLKPGEFVWAGVEAPEGPIVVVVSLAEQRAYVYRNGVEIGVSTTSSGKPGHETPTGVFVVLQKDKDHHSKTYHNAPMPDTERLTWGGVALHAGGLPGYPSSHGCVHLPSAFARLLFDAAHVGMTVVIADDRQSPRSVLHPSAISPVDAATGADDELPRLGAGEDQRWQPEKSPGGPVSIVVSGADRRAIVFRNGKEIGRAKIQLRDSGTPLGTHAFVMLAGTTDGKDGTPRAKWQAVGIPGHAGEDKRPLDPAAADRVSLPPAFRKAVGGVLSPGATLVVTDAPILEQATTGVAMNVMNSDAPTAAATKID